MMTWKETSRTNSRWSLCFLQPPRSWPCIRCRGCAWITLKVQAQAAHEFSVIHTGRTAAICGRVENHLILTTYREVLQAEGEPVQPLASSR